MLVRLRAISTAACTNEDTVRLNLSSSPIVFAGSNQLSCSGSVTVHGVCGECCFKNMDNKRYRYICKCLPNTGNYSVRILDETGVIHLEQQLSVTSGVAADVSLAGLNKGLYIIQMTSGDEVYNTKVVKF